MWGPWNIFPPTKSQQEEWKNIPDSVFWIKITFLITIIALIGLTLFLVINS